ncbi:sugar ABC transporter substrate-binding protein [Spirochaetia bacterium]|nr:sugar ABC transporter substrate-binding protein [Spirochaetia bacterium]
MTKKTMKQGTALILATLLFVSTAACSKPKGATGGVQSASEPAKLLIWEMNWGPGEKQETAFKKLLDKFTGENPNITVEHQIIPWAGYYDIFMTAINSRTAPDASTGGGAQVGLYAKMGALTSLEPIIDGWKAEKNPILDDFSPMVTDLWRYDGDLKALMFGSDPKVIIYRKDYVEQAGVTSVPKTFGEFADALRKVKAKFPDKVPLAMAASDSTRTHNTMLFLAANETGFLKADMSPNLQSKEAQESLNFIKLLYDEGLISKGTAGYTNSESERIFMTDGAVYVSCSSPGALGGVPFFDQCVVLPPLTGPSATKGHASNTPNAIFSFSNTKYPDQARAYIKFFMENSKDYFIESGHGNYPTRLSYYKDPYWANSPMHMQYFEYAINNNLPWWWPVPEMYPAILNISGERVVGDALQKIVMGMDPIKAAAESDKAIQEILTTYN